MNGHNEDSIERGTKIRRVTDREVRAGLVETQEATLRTLQEAHALIGLLGKQRDEARVTAAKQMGAIHEAMRILDKPDDNESLVKLAMGLNVKVEQAKQALLKATSA